MGQYFTNDNSIPSKLVKTRAVVLNNSFIFYTDNGVFSKDGLDFGSRLLLENIPLTEIGESLLDVGCGYGVFGIVLNKILGVKVTMCDVNRRALHLAEKNIQILEKNVIIDMDDKNCIMEGIIKVRTKAALRHETEQLTAPDTEDTEEGLVLNELE